MAGRQRTSGPGPAPDTIRRVSRLAGSKPAPTARTGETYTLAVEGVASGILLARAAVPPSSWSSEGEVCPLVPSNRARWLGSDWPHSSSLRARLQHISISCERER